MKYLTTFKYTLLAAAVLILAGCKLAVIVVEGGEVQSVGSDTCMAGTVCIHEITETNFTEQFTAVPEIGWRFVKWNKGGGFFCGNSIDPTCAITNVAAQGNPVIEAVVASNSTFFIMPVFEVSAVGSVQLTFESTVTFAYAGDGELPDGVAVEDTVTFSVVIPMDDATPVGQIGRPLCVANTARSWRFPRSPYRLTYSSGYVQEGTIDGIDIIDCGEVEDAILFYGGDFDIWDARADTSWFSGNIPEHLGSATADIDQAGLIELTFYPGFTPGWGSYHYDYARPQQYTLVTRSEL